MTASDDSAAYLAEIERLKAENEKQRQVMSKVSRLLDSYRLAEPNAHSDVESAYWLLSDYLEFGDLPNA